MAEKQVQFERSERVEQVEKVQQNEQVKQDTRTFIGEPLNDNGKFFLVPVMSINKFGTWLFYQIKLINLSNIILIVVLAIVSSKVSDNVTRIQDANSEANGLIQQLNIALSNLTIVSSLLNEFQQLNV